MTHKELVELVAEAWNAIDVSIIEPYISDDFEFDSFWVFETMKGKERYIDYLTGKFDAIRRSGNTIIIKTLFQGRINENVVVLVQGDIESALQVWGNDDRITKMWLRPVELLLPALFSSVKPNS